MNYRCIEAHAGGPADGGGGQEAIRRAGRRVARAALRPIADPGRGPADGRGSVAPLARADGLKTVLAVAAGLAATLGAADAGAGDAIWSGGGNTTNRGIDESGTREKKGFPTDAAREARP